MAVLKDNSTMAGVIIVNESKTQTLTNKTLIEPHISGALIENSHLTLDTEYPFSEIWVPKNILFYYGYPSSFNYLTNAWYSERVAKDMAQYDIIVFGNTVGDPAHPDFTRSMEIISRIKQIKPSVIMFGYASINLPLAEFKTKCDQWNAISQIDGIFFDECGYDYGVTRQHMNLGFDYVHAQRASICFPNGWNIKYVLGTDDMAEGEWWNNADWNPSEDESALNEDDWYLMESYPVNTWSYNTSATPSGCIDQANWYARGVIAVEYRETYGINLATTSQIEIDHADDIERKQLADFCYYTALVFSIDAYSVSSKWYGAVDPNLPIYEIPIWDHMGIQYEVHPYLALDPTNWQLYFRFTNKGKMDIDYRHALPIITWEHNTKERSINIIRNRYVTSAGIPENNDAFVWNASLSAWDYMPISAAGSITNHSELFQLDYLSSGHTGFSSAGHIHDDRYYTEAEVDAMIATENLWDRSGTVLSPATAGDSVKLDNDTWFEADNVSNDQVIKIVKVNINDESEIGSAFKMGGLEGSPDSGPTILFDKLISHSCLIGSDQGVEIALNNNSFVKYYCEADGYGGIQNEQIKFHYPISLISLKNDIWLNSKSYEGSSEVPIIKVNPNDESEMGSSLRIGGLKGIPDSGPIVFFDKIVTHASISGSEQSFTLGIDAENFIKFYAAADGYGGIENQKIDISVDLEVAGFSVTGHNHDLRYYTESENDVLLAGKADTVHSHTESQISDLDHDAVKIRGRTVSDSDVPTDRQVITWAASLSAWDYQTVSGAGAGTDHNLLHNLDYANSGHVGFASAGHDHDDRYYTVGETNSLLSGYSVTGHDHDDRYYTEVEVDALTWLENDITDLDKYTQAEVDAMIATENLWDRSGSTLSPTSAGDSVKLDNDIWFEADNAANDNVIHIVKVNTNDESEIGSSFKMGSCEGVPDSGITVLFDKLISHSCLIDSEQSAEIALNNNTFLKYYCEADGYGGIQNEKVEFYYPLLLHNDNWISSKSYDNSSEVPIIKVNLNDESEIGSSLRIGGLKGIPDSGPIVFFDKIVTHASISASEQSFSMGIGSDNLIKFYAEADGYGGVENKRINIPILESYATNAAAISGGLIIGDLYRTNADPSVVCVVY